MKKGIKIVNITTLVIAAILTVLMCSLTTETETTISSMQIKYPVLGIIWSVFAATAVWLNLEWLRKASGIENKFFRGVVLFGSFIVLLTPFTMPESPVGFTLSFVNLHRLCSVLFAVISYIAMITILFAKKDKQKKIYRFLAAALLFVGLLNVYGIFAMGGYISGLMETVLVIAGLAVLLIVNFILPNVKKRNHFTVSSVD